MTIESDPGYRIYSVGLTRQPLRKRFLQHRRKFLSGDYNILDLDSARRGDRALRWKGWGWTDEKRSRFEAQRVEVEAAANAQMSATAIFEVQLPDEERLFERAEAAIVTKAHELGNDLIDRGMFLARKREGEEDLSLSFRGAEYIHRLPNSLEI